MSDELIQKMLPIAGPLLGAVVGGLIAAFAAYGIEHSRWRRERQEKLMGLKREALAAALEWIEPMRNAETQASGLVMSAIRGQVSDEDFLKRFPYLVGDLAKKDVPANQRAVLPDNVYARGHRIILEFEELQYLGVKYGQEARVMGRPMAGFQECSSKLDTIGKQISGLEADLKKAYGKTFE
jgi:hypothetical protein